MATEWKEPTDPLGWDSSAVVSWVNQQPQFAKFAPLFGGTAGDVLRDYTSEDLERLGLPRLHAVPLSVKIRQLYSKRRREGEPQILSPQRQRLDPFSYDVNGVTDIVIRSERHDAIATIKSRLATKRTLLIRAPPFAGKTSLAQLLKEHLQQDETHGEILSIHVVSRPPEPLELDNFWKQRIHMTMTELFSRTTPTTLIVDDAQILYGTEEKDERKYECDGDKRFWSYIKELASSSTSNVRVVLFASYGEKPSVAGASTPIEFAGDSSLGMEVLLLTRSEFDEMVDSHNRESLVGKGVQISTEVRNALFTCTHGHAGICRLALDFFHRKWSGNINPASPTDDDLIKALMSDSFISNVKHQRAVQTELLTNPSHNQFVRDMLLADDCRHTLAISANEAKIAAELIQHGLICLASDGWYHFPSPILRLCLIGHLFKPSQIAHQSQRSFEDCLDATIEQFSKNRLTESQSLGKDDRMLERQWHMEFYRAACLTLGQRIHISPDVGPVFNCRQNIDFLINGSLQWGIELLRDGHSASKNGLTARQEHEARAVEYQTNVKLNRIAVLDFVSQPPDTQTDIEANTWIVHYAKNFASVKIHRHGLPPYKL